MNFRQSNDVFMFVDLSTLYGPLPPEEPGVHIHVLHKLEFCHRENLRRDFERLLWKSFSTRGKFDLIYEKTDWICVATNDNGHLISVALVIVIGEKWIIEYVMTDSEVRGQGVGTRLIKKLLSEAKQKSAKWAMLNCDPTKENGALLRFYENLGFRELKVPVLA